MVSTKSDKITKITTVQEGTIHLMYAVTVHIVIQLQVLNGKFRNLVSNKLTEISKLVQQNIAHKHQSGFLQNIIRCICHHGALL